ncbi:MAG: hypothetical protein N3J91_08800 [Verrucomicrobiae bacterium]|nr:hypothetical protein [Verrucomicrobiae bacterium]
MQLLQSFSATAGLVLATGLALAQAPAGQTVPPALRLGTAAVDITPPLGILLAGYYHERGADGVLDPLLCKAVVLESGGERAALVALDLIWVTRPVTDAARAAIEQATGIKVGGIMICATHAHTGPELAHQGLRHATLGEPQALVKEYTARLPARIAEAVRRADQARQPALLSAVKARCENLTFNRRYFMRDGSVAWNPGKLNPNVMLPAGPADAEVGVLLFESPGARGPAQSLATLVHYAMHTDTTGGSKFSADWPGALSRVLAGYHGTQHLSLVLNGACGNLNHIDVNWRWPQSSPLEQHRIGTILGATVFQSYKQLQPLAPGAIRFASQWVDLPAATVSPAEVEAARRFLAEAKDDRGANFMQKVRAYRALDLAAQAGQPYRVEVQVIALGREIAWISLPGEVFTELGLAMKKRSPFPFTFPVYLANESVGYIPDRRSYAEGAYEPESARVAPGAGEQLVDTAVALLQRLYQGP